MMLQLGRAANGRTEGALRGRGLICFGEKDMREEERRERLTKYYRERVMGLFLGFKDDGLSCFFFLADLIWLNVFLRKLIYTVIAWSHLRCTARKF